MATTLAVLTPESALPMVVAHTTAVPALVAVRDRLALAYDDSTAEYACWSLVAPQNVSGTLTLYILYCMASATSGGVVFGAQVEAVTDGDALDIDAEDSFDTENLSATETVPATAGYVGSLSITLTNKDSIAAGDLVRIQLRRAPAETGDTATGDCYVLAAELRVA